MDNTNINNNIDNKQEKNRNIMLDSINKISKNSKIYKSLYNILKLTSTSKK